MGGKALTGVRAERVNIRRGIAESVSCKIVRGKEKGKNLEVSAEVVVISCGAIWTPYLLKKSGIKNPNIGRHLHLHPIVAAGAIYTDRIECWKGVPQNYYTDEFLETDGILILTGAVPPPVAGMIIHGHGKEHRGWMLKYPGFVDAGALVSDTSEGSVSFLGDIPLVRYSIRDEDLKKMEKALTETCRILLAGGAEAVFPMLLAEAPVKSEKDLRKIKEIFQSRKFVLTGSLHPMGTCRMGTSPENSVVDGYGRVHGIKNLVIADGSVLPSSITVNPQQTIMMLACHIAEGVMS